VSAEKKEISVWGLALNMVGAIVLIYGFISAQMLMVPQVPSFQTVLAEVVLIAGFALIVFVAKSGGDKKAITTALGGLNAWGLGATVVVVVSFLFLVIPGGEGEMIPETAWPLLMGALTMIGSGFAAAACIVAAVRAGAEMITEKPELSIWSLLFVALGEGLAIYGLIVAILLIGG
jgi:F0F1-type ATP synthase membrane subunit c/vacuolar-type H+-ATPase subunit K